MRVYSWNKRNVELIAENGVTPVEAHHVVEHARLPFPRSIGAGKWMVRGRANNGRWLQVIYANPDDADVDTESLSPADLMAFSEGRAKVVYVVYARDLNDAEKRKLRK